MFRKYAKIPSAEKILLAMFLLAILAISIKLASNWSFPDTAWTISKDDKVELKKNEQPVWQKFVADRDGLSRIEVLLGSSKQKGAIVMKILDENCEKILREGKLEESALDSDQTYAFNFSKISDSRNKTFCFSISSDAEKTGSKYPSVFIRENQVSGGGSLRVPFANEEFQNKSLSMRPGYRNLKWSDNFTQLNQRISQYKPFFLKHYYLWTIIALFLILSIALVAIFILI